MTIESFKAYVKARKALNTEEIHHFMDDMSNEARRITFRLNTAYHVPGKVCLAILFHRHFECSLHFILISERIFP